MPNPKTTSVPHSRKGQEKPFCTMKWLLQGHARKPSGHLETKLWPMKRCNSSTEQKAQLSRCIYYTFKKSTKIEAFLKKGLIWNFIKTCELQKCGKRTVGAFMPPKTAAMVMHDLNISIPVHTSKSSEEMWAGNTEKQIKLMTKDMFPILDCLKSSGISRTEMQKQFPSEELKKIFLLKIHQVQWVPGLQGGHSECQHIIHLSDP